MIRLQLLLMYHSHRFYQLSILKTMPLSDRHPFVHGIRLLILMIMIPANIIMMPLSLFYQWHRCNHQLKNYVHSIMLICRRQLGVMNILIRQQLINLLHLLLTSQALSPTLITQRSNYTQSLNYCLHLHLYYNSIPSRKKMILMNLCLAWIQATEMIVILPRVSAWNCRTNWLFLKQMFGHLMSRICYAASQRMRQDLPLQEVNRRHIQFLNTPQW